MERLQKKVNSLKRRKARIRADVEGTTQRPRLSVFISSRHVSAQVIDDSKQTTLVAVTTAGAKVDGNLTAKAEWVGAEVAKKATAKKIKKVVLDRNGRLYHGRIKALADAARKGGLEF